MIWHASHWCISNYSEYYRNSLVQGISFSFIICFGSHFFLFHPHLFSMVVVATGIGQTKKMKGEGEIKFFDLHLLQKRKRWEEDTAPGRPLFLDLLIQTGHHPGNNSRRPCAPATVATSGKEKRQRLRHRCHVPPKRGLVPPIVSEPREKAGPPLFCSSGFTVTVTVTNNKTTNGRRGTIDRWRGR